mgnify:CR=1 FL=1
MPVALILLLQEVPEAAPPSLLQPNLGLVVFTALVFGIVLPPPGYNLDQLMEMGETVEAELRPYWDVDPNSPEAQSFFKKMKEFWNDLTE